MRHLDPTTLVLRQVLASQAVAVLIEPVWVSTHEKELGLFLGLEVLAVVVACRGHGPRGLGLLPSLGIILRWLGAFGVPGLGFRGFVPRLAVFLLELGRLVRSYDGYDVRDQVVAHYELPFTVLLDQLLRYGGVDLRVSHDVAIR